MAYSRREVKDNETVMDKDLYDNLQDGIDEALGITTEVSKTHNVETYTSLSQISLEEGRETIEGITTALPDNSKLQMKVTKNHNTTIYPKGVEGIFIAEKSDNCCKMEFVDSNSPTKWLCVCYVVTDEKNGESCVKTEWEKISTDNEHNLKTYTSLEQIGLEVGSETIESIVNALQEDSMLTITISPSNNSIYPESSGFLKVTKTAQYVKFEFDSSQESWKSLYTITPPEWYGWVLSSDGGNADTLDGYHASEFDKLIAVESTDTLANLWNSVPNSGKGRFIYLSGVPSDFPTDLGNPYRNGYMSVEIKKVNGVGYYILDCVESSGVPFVIVGYCPGNSTISWRRIANANDFLPLTGGTLKGDLYSNVDNGNYLARFAGNLNGAYIFAQEKGSSDNRHLYIGNFNGRPDANDALILCDIVNGEAKSHNVLHSSNIGHYALLTTGGTMTGSVTMDNGSNEVGLTLKRIYNDSLHAAKMYRDNAGNLVVGLMVNSTWKNRIILKPDGVAYHTYDTGDRIILDTGNSKPVAIQETAPSDTSALWAW